MEGLRIAACFFSFVSLSLLIIALATDYWRVNSDGSRHAGLWQACDNNVCLSYGMYVLDYIHAIRAFLLMGLVAGAVSFFGIFASLFHTHIGSISIKHLVVLASGLAGICCMVAMATFTKVYFNQFSLPGTNVGWSSGIGWASSILFLIKVIPLGFLILFVGILTPFGSFIVKSGRPLIEVLDYQHGRTLGIG